MFWLILRAMESNVGQRFYNKSKHQAQCWLLLLSSTIFLAWVGLTGGQPIVGWSARASSAIWQVTAMPSVMWRHFRTHWQSYESLHESNMKLRLQQQILQAKIHRLYALQKQNKQLRQLLSSSTDVGGISLWRNY